MGLGKVTADEQGEEHMIQELRNGHRMCTLEADDDFEVGNHMALDSGRKERKTLAS